MIGNDRGPELDPKLAQALADLAAMEKERDRWRRALNDCTPGGSEYAGNPEECVRYIRARWESVWESNKRLVLRDRRLEAALGNAMKALHMMRDGGESPELKALARDVILQIQEQLGK